MSGWRRAGRCITARWPRIAAVATARHSRIHQPLFMRCISQTTSICTRRHQRGIARPARHHSTSSASFACKACGQQYAKWQGQCSACHAWGEIAEVSAPIALYRQGTPTIAKAKRIVSKSSSSSWSGSIGAHAAPPGGVFRMRDVDMGALAERIELGDRELDWVLGGGLVAGSLTLLAGNPGVGKSTVALQIANMLAQTSTVQQELRHVLYVSGEESVLQVKMRAERLQATSAHLFVGSETNLDAIIHMIESRPRSAIPANHLADPNDMDTATHVPFDAVVVDSVQTLFAEDVPSAAGTVNQVKECTLRLLRLAKQRQIPLILIGHVTKSGDIAGPKVLEHIVDTVVQLDGDPQSSRRFLRCQKNRFGNTSEVGVFSMTDRGLQPLANPLRAFLPDSATQDAQEDDPHAQAALDGTSLTIAMEGSRPIPIEIQVLANRASYFNSQESSGRFSSHGGGGGFSRIRGVGVSWDKLQLLLAVLEKRGKLSLAHRNVFVNVAEGYTIQEPAADLALVVAIASAATNRAVRPRMVLFGELALSGHLRPVKMLDARLAAAHKIGLEVCIIPTARDEDAKQIVRKYADRLRVLEASTVLQAIELALAVAPKPATPRRQQHQDA